jgi:hypothetical protein
MRRRRSRQDGLVEVMWDSSMSPRAVLLSSDGGRVRVVVSPDVDEVALDALLPAVAARVLDAIDRFDDPADERPAPPHLRLVR